ncbi:MAG: PKD domain-containing protein [Candidatus Bathyarchaeia archaeon]
MYDGPTTSHTYTATMTAPSQPGTYYYKVFGQDGHSGPAGATGWDVYSITVTAAPGNQPPNARFTYLPDGLTVKFIDQSWDPDGTITSWSWDFGDGTTSNSTNPTHTFPAMGTFNVILTVTDDQGDSGVASEIIMVPPKGERTQLWTTQVAIVSVAIAFLSFVAVGIARKIGEKEGK